MTEEFGEIATRKSQEDLYQIAVGVNYGMAGKIKELIDSFKVSRKDDEPSGDSIPFKQGQSVSI